MCRQRINIISIGRYAIYAYNTQLQSKNQSLLKSLKIVAIHLHHQLVCILCNLTVSYRITSAIILQNKKQLMSVVCECLRHASILREVLELSSFQLCDKRFKKNEELALVVLHQHLFGKGLNGCYSKFKVHFTHIFKFSHTRIASVGERLILWFAFLVETKIYAFSKGVNISCNRFRLIPQ